MNRDERKIADDVAIEKRSDGSVIGFFHVHTSLASNPTGVTDLKSKYGMTAFQTNPPMLL